MYLSFDADERTDESWKGKYLMGRGIIYIMTSVVPGLIKIWNQNRPL